MKQNQSLNRSNTTCEDNRSFNFCQPKAASHMTSLCEKDDREEKKPSAETMKIEYIDIKLPKNGPRGSLEEAYPGGVNESGCNLAFTFEKKRIEMLGMEKLAKFQEDGPTADVDLCDPRVVSFQAKCKIQMDKDTEEVQKWSLLLKVLSVVVACVTILSATLSMLFLFILALNTSTSIINSAIPLILNMAASLWMLNVAIKGTGVSNTAVPNDRNFRRFFYYCGASAIVFLLQFIIMAGINSIPELIDGLGDIYASKQHPDADKKRAEAYIKLVYLLVWILSIFNFGASAVSGAFAFLLQHNLRKQEVHHLEQQALPLGYQMHTKYRTQSNSSNKY